MVVLGNNGDDDGGGLWIETGGCRVKLGCSSMWRRLCMCSRNVELCVVQVTGLAERRLAVIA